MSRPQARRLIEATRKLRKEVAPLRFGAPVSHVYNPLEYAKRPHHEYLRRYGNGRKPVLLLGMNPGPFGMAQTGVPFGEIAHVRDWLGIQAPVARPPVENPRRPIEGFSCQRSEVSGARLWGAVARHFVSPEKFFHEHFIANYCPLIFMEASGRNCTPDKLPASERDPLFRICDAFLLRMVEILEPEWVIGVGAFAARQAERALAGSLISVSQILHPSPANPLANRDWEGEVKRAWARLGLCPK